MSDVNETKDVEIEEETNLGAEETYEDDDIPAADDYDDDDSSYDDDDDGETDVSFVDGPAVFARTRDGRRRRNVRAMVRDVKIEDLNYKRVQVLSQFVDRQGRILSRRKTRISAKMQRKVALEIKRARHLALMPYTREHVRITRKRS